MFFTSSIKKAVWLLFPHPSISKRPNFLHSPMRTMRVQRILLLLSSLIPLSKSYCSTPGLSYLPFIASPFSLLCSMLSSSPQPSYFRLEPKVDWTPNCGAGLGQIEKDTLVSLLQYNCKTRVLLSRNLQFHT